MNDIKLRLRHLLMVPGGLCFRRNVHPRSHHYLILQDVAFQLHVMLGLGELPGDDVIDEINTLEQAGRLDVRHDDERDETTLTLRATPDDQELGEQAAGDLERMADLMGRIASSAEGPKPKLVSQTAPTPITVLDMGQGAEHIVLAASTQAAADLLRQLHTIATSVRT